MTDFPTVPDSKLCKRAHPVLVFPAPPAPGNRLQSSLAPSSQLLFATTPPFSSSSLKVEFNFLCRRKAQFPRHSFATFNSLNSFGCWMGREEGTSPSHSIKRTISATRYKLFICLGVFCLTLFFILNNRFTFYCSLILSYGTVFHLLNLPIHHLGIMIHYFWYLVFGFERL